MHDTLKRFLIDETDVRGEHVDLSATWKAALSNVDYPPPVREVLGKLMAASLLLTGTLKFQGSLKLEARGDGPLTLAVIQATSAKTVRGLAHWQGPVPVAEDLRDLLGQEGHFVLTLEPAEEGQRYQGIVGLEGGDVAGVLEDYFARSEQLPTRLWLAADENQAGGMLLQRMPERQGDDPDAWNRAVHLAETVTAGELLSLPANDLLYRLFHEETVRVFEPELVNFRCTCTQQKVGDMLRGLGREEVRDILAQEDEVRVHCEFCGKAYVFDAVDVEQLFTATPPGDGSGSRH